MNLTTTYMGFTLPHPLVPGASPMVDDLDTARRLEDAGAPMLVMHSLFEEQIVREEMSVHRSIEAAAESFGEALSYLPQPEEFSLGPDEYLEQVRKLKKAVSIPVIASLNGTSEGGWLRYARLIEQAGADGLELNLYDLSTDTDESGEDIERRQLDVVRAVCDAVKIPLAVKLSPFYSSMANFAHRLDRLGIDALVLFNRFYHPEIDIESLELRRVNPSSPSELPLRLRWIGVLSGRLSASLAATGGVHSADGVIRCVMAGAHAVQMVSALLSHGPEYLETVRRDLAQWLEEHEYESLQQMQGSMSLLKCGDPAAYQRANYMRILNSWQAD